MLFMLTYTIFDQHFRKGLLHLLSTSIPGIFGEMKNATAIILVKEKAWSILAENLLKNM